MTALIFKTIKREFLLNVRDLSELLHPLIFFMVVVSLFPLAISPDPKLLASIGPGIIWMAVLFASILSFPNLFYHDYQDGSLEQSVLNIRPLSMIVLTKVLLHSALLGIPLLILSPVLAMGYHLDHSALIALMLSLLIGIPSLCLLGAIGSAITVSLNQSGILLALILLPLYVPILIFASSAVLRSERGESVNAELALLGAIFIFLLMLAPIVTSYCLKVAVED